MAIPTRHSVSDEIVSGLRTFFVTSATLGHRRLLQSERMARLLIDALYHYRGQGKYRLHEFVVMPDHFHALLSVGSTMTVERAMQLIKGGSSYCAGKEFGVRNLWQRGFSEVRIIKADEYVARVEYIRGNPIRARLAECAEEYVYCSAYPGYEVDPSPFAGAKALARGAASGGTTEVMR
ncbi:MAG: transposase [Terriglobales bacterium]